MRQEGQVVGRERRRLKVRKKGDIMERIELLNYCPGHSWDAGISPTAADIPEAAAGCLCQSVQHTAVCGSCQYVPGSKISETEF
jgi:hypothetical protein